MADQDVSRSEYDASPLLIKVSVVMPILSVLVVGLRVWSRRIGRTQLGMDDWLIIMAQAFSFGIPIAAVLSALHGVGKHIEVVEAEDPNNMQWVMGILFVGELAYISLIGLIKVSILQLYLHVFPTPYMNKGVKGIYVLLALWTVGCMILTIFQCTPINAAWDKSLVRSGAAHCVDQGAYFIGVAVPHTATDVLILTLPLFELRKLQMPNWKKWAISGIFLLGGFIVVVSIVRLTTLIAMYNAGDEADTTVLLMPVELWTVTEVSVAIICACLPTLGPLVARFGPATLRLLSTGRRGASNTAGSATLTPSSGALDNSNSSSNHARQRKQHQHQHRHFSPSRSNRKFQRLDGDSSVDIDGDGDGGPGAGVGADDDGFYPKVTPKGYAVEHGVEISAAAAAGGGGCRRMGSPTAPAAAAVVAMGAPGAANGHADLEADEIPLQGIHVKQDMTWTVVEDSSRP
ncbi:uncharacterized protein B0I36DRAFT_368153 [Microdochium trichocladiopsis]|uniref:Rhodopsin domain-containing protein n=1 Tax=Microdochium trichocladiopsis TaxID=1682393 RepID=A0A9P9BK53_9PEZI|nr:uncharacterized protein B0I36DRAFT_368153 [Microdochium trichocladiopsis]KAH7018106.1 hypothetical protein B0I36DRAFT_368153 [Microdochium trichocladiopsis]